MPGRDNPRRPSPHEIGGYRIGKGDNYDEAPTRPIPDKELRRITGAVDPSVVRQAEEAAVARGYRKEEVIKGLREKRSVLERQIDNLRRMKERDKFLSPRNGDKLRDLEDRLAVVEAEIRRENSK